MYRKVCQKLRMYAKSWKSHIWARPKVVWGGTLLGSGGGGHKNFKLFFHWLVIFTGVAKIYFKIWPENTEKSSKIWKKSVKSVFSPKILHFSFAFFFLAFKPVVSNRILSVTTFIKIWVVYSVFTITNPVLNKCLSPHVANGDKVGQHCFKQSK